MKHIISMVLVFGMWMLLTWSVDYQQVIAGAGFSVLVVVFFANLLPRRPARFFEPKRWFWALVYLPYFLYYCVRANLDVAYRVLHPDMPIRPGIVKVTTGLRTDMAKAFLANSITLTPGTLTVDIIGQELYIHWINVSTDDPEEQTREIVGTFEPMLRKIFE